MKKVMLVLMAVLLMVSFTFGGEKTCSKACAKEVDAVKKTIEFAYVNGIHINRDVAAVKKGFHPEFNMLVRSDEDIKKVSINEWTDKIAKWKEKEPKITTDVKHKFTMVEVAGDAAVARVEIFKDGAHVYTDFMSLYKFNDGWKIVNKIYQSHNPKKK